MRVRDGVLTRRAEPRIVSPDGRRSQPSPIPVTFPGKRHLRKSTWSEATPEGRWRVFEYAELVKRDKANLDIFWLRDKSLEDSDNLPEPDILAQEILDDLQSAIQQFAAVAAELASAPSASSTADPE